MLSEKLAQELENEVTRLGAAQVVGVVQETTLLNHIRQAYLRTSSAETKAVLDWAGRRLHIAHKNAYSTIGELCREFRLQPESPDDDAEKHLLQQMQSGLDSDLRQMQNQGRMDNMAQGAIVGVALGGGVLGAMGGAAMGASSSSYVSSSSLSADGGLNQYKGPSRIPPKRPFDTVNQIWLRRLTQDPDPKKRIQAAKEIIEWNNPDVLPDLALAYHNEKDAEVQTAVERTAKLIYWNVVYWEMSQANLLENAVTVYHRTKR